MLPALLIAVAGPYSFLDKTSALGLSIPGDAACWVDIDNDGYTDLIAGAVWKNNQGKSFTKMQDVGSVVAADFDNDGFVDLFSWSQVKLYRNNKGKSFEPLDLPTHPDTVSHGACWGDFNKDGLVDLYVGGYEDWGKQITYPTLFFVNNQGKSFTLAWHEAAYRTRGVTACDFDRDGDLDIYASNYRLQPNLLRVNDGAGKFKNRAAEYNVVATSGEFKGGHSIGACWGDFDEDGQIDLFAGNFAHVDNRGDQPKSRFLKNLGVAGGYKFEDLGTCGIFYQESYASPAAGDYDNDGDLDLYFTTVYATASFGKKNFPVLFRNDGKFSFSDATLTAGLAEQPATYQAAWADFDNDGDLDLCTAGKLFVNEGGANRWLEVRLLAPMTIGAQVRVKLKGKVLTRHVEAGTGQGNQNDSTLHFGLGAHRDPLDVEVSWANGKSQTVKGVATNRRIDVTGSR
jgi:enediyne biosynthesis protein E4